MPNRENYGSIKPNDWASMSRFMRRISDRLDSLETTTTVQAKTTKSLQASVSSFSSAPVTTSGGFGNVDLGVPNAPVVAYFITKDTTGQYQLYVGVNAPTTNNIVLIQTDLQIAGDSGFANLVMPDAYGPSPFGFSYITSNTGIYYIRARVQNDIGWGPWSGTAIASIDANATYGGPDTDVPSVPQNVTAINDTTQAQLSGLALRIEWDAPANNATGIFAYAIEINDSATFPGNTQLGYGTTGVAVAGTYLLTDPNRTFDPSWATNKRTVWIYKSVIDGEHVVSDGQIISVSLDGHTATLNSQILVSGTTLNYEVIVPSWEQVVRSITVPVTIGGGTSGLRNRSSMGHYTWTCPTGLLPNAQYYIIIRAANEFGEGPWSPVCNGLVRGLKPTDMNPYSQGALGNATSFIGVIAGSFTNNSPSAGHVAWSGIQINYLGTTYNITNGNTASGFIYWLYSNPTILYGSATLPVLGNNDCLIGLNGAGTFISTWNATTTPAATVVGTLVASQIYVAYLSDLTANVGNLTAGSLTAISYQSSAANPRMAIDSTYGLRAFNSGGSLVTQIALDGTITASVGSITGVTITGGTIQTATTGARVVLTSANGLQAYDGSNNLVLQIADNSYSQITLQSLQIMANDTIDIYALGLNHHAAITLHPVGRSGGTDTVAKIISQHESSSYAGELELVASILWVPSAYTAGVVVQGGSMQVKDATGTVRTLLCA